MKSEEQKQKNLFLNPLDLWNIFWAFHLWSFPQPIKLKSLVIIHKYSDFYYRNLCCNNKGGLSDIMTKSAYKGFLRGRIRFPAGKRKQWTNTTEQSQEQQRICIYGNHDKDTHDCSCHWQVGYRDSPPFMYWWGTFKTSPVK